jgi:type IV secretion system protein TrbD
MLFLGGDREMVMVTGMIAVMLIFVAQTWAAAVFGIALWLCALFLLRSMAKQDPLLRQNYIRSLYYLEYYRSYSTPHRKNTRSYGDT